MRKVLVTGATGFLGGWTVARLLDSGYEVAVCLNARSRSTHRADSSYHRNGLERRCEEFRADLTRYKEVETLLQTAKPDAIVHMAALGDVTVSIKQPLETFHCSATISANLFEAVRRAGRHVPIVSHTTDKVYGNNEVPFRETMALRPFHVYEIAKATQDHLGQFYAQQYGLPIVTVRCGNYFGPNDFNFNRIVPYTIRQNLLGKSIVLRSDGNFTRDFLYVEDAADVNLRLLTALRDGTPGVSGEALNFSLEVQITVREMVATICRLMDVPQRIRVEGGTPAEIADMRLACDKARHVLGWVPKYPLEPALRRTIDAYRTSFQPDAPPDTKRRARTKVAYGMPVASVGESST